MSDKDLDQIKVHLPKDLKSKFAAKVRKESKTQTGVIKSLIHNYLNS